MGTIYICSFFQDYVKSMTFYHNIVYHNTVWRDLDHVSIPQNNTLIHYIQDTSHKVRGAKRG